MTTFSRLGVLLSSIYLILAAYLMYSQGLFGESFITLLLGLPWTLLLSFFEYGGVSGALLYVLALLPIGINAALLYWIGKIIGR